MSKPELLIFDSHPVQYRVPVWKLINRIAPESIHVIYATVSSVTGYFDRGFNEKIAWDDPLLEGYPYTSLEAVNGTPFAGRRSLTGSGVQAIIQQLQPKSVLLTGLNYQFDLTALRAARKAGIPVYLRCENQDRAFPRPFWKDYLRALYYRRLYRSIDRFYYIGQLNKQHYLRHGVRMEQLVPAHYFTVDRLAGCTRADKLMHRTAVRTKAGIAEADVVIGFSGKLIPKKNPGLLFRLVDQLPDELRAKTVLYFMGSGALEAELKETARAYQVKYGLKTVFTGFVNQSRIARHYLAMDVFVLPSRQMGETWGLVVNEALQAGCSVAVSHFVGCGEDFTSLERFEVFADDDAEELAEKVTALSKRPRSFDWARPALTFYSLEACVDQLIEDFSTIHPAAVGKLSY